MDRYKDIRGLIIFLLPALLFYTIFMIVPTVMGLSYSFTDWNGLNPNYNFVGLRNFINALTQDKNFLNSIQFTLKYVLALVVLANLFALFLAALIDSRRKTQNLFRTTYFVPNMVSYIIGAYIWQFIFKVVLKELAERQYLGFLGQPWLGNPNFSFWAIVIMSLWTSVGYIMVIYIAALQGIPVEFKEAARVDGANQVQVFFKITLPMIMHAVTINSFLTLRSGFMTFDQIYGLTGGGPGRSTQVMSLNIYEEAFSSYFRYGYANAKGIILFLFVLLLTFIQFRVTRRRELHS
ncbi:MAG: carbohydrate ABC transporter permease [Halanaerobiales bacterium]